MKSPNMMSTTGRKPVMAAPTARPVKPASEIGVSMTRSLPNSSTRPFTTLNGVPGFGDVLTEQDHVAIAPHLLRERLANRIAESDVARTGCRRFGGP